MPTRTTKSHGPDPVDVHVGARIRMRRVMSGMSQEKLGDALGLTFQQVQKYERGANRVSASKLWDLSNILDVPVSFFFDDMPEDLKQAGTARPTTSPAPDGGLGRRRNLELVRHFQLCAPKMQDAIYSLVKAAARDENVARSLLPPTQAAE